MTDQSDGAPVVDAGRVVVGVARPPLPSSEPSSEPPPSSEPSSEPSSDPLGRVVVVVPGVVVVVVAPFPPPTAPPPDGSSEVPPPSSPGRVVPGEVVPGVDPAQSSADVVGVAADAPPTGATFDVVEPLSP